MRAAACFVITALLASVLVSAAPKTAGGTSSIPERLGRRVRGFLARGPHWDGAMSRADHPDQLAAGAGAQGIQHVEGEKCYTKAQCKKKKVICSKKCSKPPGGVGECVFKCKKCIPNC